MSSREWVRFSDPSGRHADRIFGFAYDEAMLDEDSALRLNDHSEEFKVGILDLIDKLTRRTRSNLYVNEKNEIQVGVDLRT
mgnify:CR=1 FL=1